MDTVLNRLQSIRQSMEHVVSLSKNQEKKIQETLFSICNKLQTSDGGEEDTSSCEDVLRMISMVERILYIPVVNHLMVRLKGRVQGNDSNRTQTIQEYTKCLAEENKLNEKPKGRNNKICESESVNFLLDDYWDKRRNRIHSLLGNSSLRFDKNYLLKSSKQKENPWDHRLAENEVEHSPQKRKPRKERTVYSKEDTDRFWGLTEDKLDNKKKWVPGETICILNCASDLNKFTEFLQQKKAERSFYVQRKPEGLAGRKGTWLTSAYKPPLVIKYGCLEKPESYLKNFTSDSKVE